MAMSEWGQTRSSGDVASMSGLPPKAAVQWTFRNGRFVPGADIASMQQQIYLNTSTVANGSADHGRKRFNVNFVFCPGWTSTRR
jgi:hypothetical protein